MRIQSKSNQTDLYNQFLLGLQLENKVPKSATAKLNPKSVFTGLKKPLNGNDNINHESPAKIPDHIVKFQADTYRIAQSVEGRNYLQRHFNVEVSKNIPSALNASIKLKRNFKMCNE